MRLEFTSGPYITHCGYVAGLITSSSAGPLQQFAALVEGAGIALDPSGQFVTAPGGCARTLATYRVDRLTRSTSATSLPSRCGPLLRK